MRPKSATHFGKCPAVKLGESDRKRTSGTARNQTLEFSFLYIGVDGKSLVFKLARLGTWSMTQTFGPVVLHIRSPSTMLKLKLAEPGYQSPCLNS